MDVEDLLFLSCLILIDFEVPPALFQLHCVVSRS